ncbi:unnamed protein product [Prorocentrum cordatum]|uniref:Uncharacterized protein n=1 Tax=Prorocentrum cordatum TaxID=2364126 RepID=A0ABN9QS87_9DINO|nr:unnamed protein product [Polarella glacialis]
MPLHPRSSRTLPASHPDAGQESAADLAEQFAWYPTVEAPGSPDFREVLYSHYRGASREMREMLTSILHPEVDASPPGPSAATPVAQPSPPSPRPRLASCRRCPGTCCCLVRHSKKRRCATAMVPRHEVLAERARRESEIRILRAEKERLFAEKEHLARELKEAKAAKDAAVQEKEAAVQEAKAAKAPGLRRGSRRRPTLEPPAMIESAPPRQGKDETGSKGPSRKRSKQTSRRMP